MPARKPSYTWTEVKAGLFFFAALVLFAFLLAVVAGARLTAEKTARYYAYFNDTLGLNKGADVRYGGARVGRVTDIRLDPKNQSRIVVVCDVDPEVPINEDSEAYIGQVTLTAEKHLEISTGTEQAKRLRSESVLPSREKDVFRMAANVGNKVGEVLDAVKEILGAGTAQAGPQVEEEGVTVPDLLQNIDGAVADLRSILGENREEIDTIVAKIRDIEDAVRELLGEMNSLVAETRPDIQAAVASVQSTAKQADAMLRDITTVTPRLDELADTLQAVLDNAKGLSAEAQVLLQDTRPYLEDIILDLRETARLAREFARDVTEQPQAIVRGRKPQGRVSEEGGT